MASDTGPIAVGDLVGYVSVIGDKTYQHIGKVYELWPEGIPSCREPMLKIEGKAGVVLVSHCTKLNDARAAIERDRMVRP